MQSSFTYSLSILKKINGNAKSDYEVAKTVVLEMESFVYEKVEIIDDYLNLKRILTNQSKDEIESLLISLKHVLSALEDVRSFHRNGQLNGIFDGAYHKLIQTVEKYEESAKKLILLVQS